MNKIKIISLTLKNFKGIKELVVNFGDKTNILGENATGKTTIADSFFWLLFDKDSQDKKDFEIKTLDGNNEVLHGLEHTVTGTLEVNGKLITLTKTFKEKWTKKKGESNKQFTGNETLYYIDEVPVKKSEYQQKINSIIEENLFKLISNPFYFNTNMKWQDRRNVMLDIVGDITPDRIINYNQNLIPLTKALEDKNIDELKRSVAARRKKLNDDIKSIPYRIDELNNSIKEYDFNELEKLLITYQDELKEIEDSLLDSGKATKDTMEKQSKMYALKTKMQGIEYAANSDKDKPLNDLKSKLQAKQYELEKTESKLSNLIEKKTLYLTNIKEVTEENDRLRAMWKEENQKTLEFDESKFICPTCNRTFEEHDIEAKKQEMTENFNSNKAKYLANIKAKGTAGKTTIEKINEDVKNIDTEIEKTRLYIAVLKDEKEKFEIEIANFVPVDTLSSNKEYQELKTQVTAMEKEIANEAAGVENNTIASTLMNKKKEVVAKIDDVKKQLNTKEQNETIRARIKELMDQEKALAEQIAKIEGQEFLCEEFIKTKVELLESGINNKFKYVNFKLFNNLINGGLEECCSAMVNGVPYESLNSAMKINAGLDIINTLSEHYGVSSPIFIDNAESINDILETNSQMICLVVSYDKQLKIENQTALEYKIKTAAQNREREVM